MNDDSGTHKLKLSDLQEPQKAKNEDGFSKDELDSLADLIGDGSDPKTNVDLEDTGRFSR
jgi:hypothetical protein